MARMDLARIQAKCIEDGDCLIWTGKVSKHNGHPAASEYIDGKDKHVGIRRRAYEEYHKVKLTPEDHVTTCGNKRCLAKGHLECVTKSEVVRRTHERMDAGTKLRRGKKISKIQQDMRGKLTPEQVQAVKDSEDGPYVTAKRLGINGVVAWRIVNGLSYKEYEANPFAGLVSRC